MKRVDLSKAVGNYLFYVLVNSMEGMRQFRDCSLPWRARVQANLKVVHVNNLPNCVSVETIKGGFLSLRLA